MTAPPHDPPTADPVQRPLVVDLDGTLVATDTLHEQLLDIAGQRPLGLLQAAGALLRGKAAFKETVASLASLDPAALPYRGPVLDLIREARAQGRPVVLASASDGSTVDAVAAHLGLFDAVIASDGSNNRKGASKLDAIRQTLADRGMGEAFDYVGDHPSDLPVWAAAHTAYTVEVDRATHQRIKSRGKTLELVARGGLACIVGELVRACRPHQWCKNLLLVVPMLAAQRAGELMEWFYVTAAFIAFGLCASAVYLVNDLLDLRADRLHPTKRNRPLAAGTLPVRYAVLAAPALAVVATLLSALLLPAMFVWTLLAYTATAWLYSFVIKRRAVLDVVWLASLYTLRVIAGGVATQTPVSPWLLALALFLFMSVALAKRYAELRLLQAEGRDTAEGRGYSVDDAQMLSVMGVSSGLLGVLVLALYINSAAVETRLYDRPEVLWLVCPLMLYWIGRLWLRAHRRLLKDDPLLFALTDKVSYIVALIVLLAAMIAA